jgi:hypothetical protein
MEADNRICIFCLRHDSRTEPFCPDNPGRGCTYGFACERVESKEEKAVKQPAKKIDKQVCLVCGTHSRNPTSLTNGCTHQYPE